MILFSKSVLMKKQTHLHHECLGVSTLSANTFFWLNYTFNETKKDTYLKSTFLNYKFQKQHVNKKYMLSSYM